MCRVCGRQKYNQRPLKSVLDFLHKLFNFNANSDSENVHPQTCCIACLNLLRRCANYKGKRGGSKSKLLELAEFSPHTEDECPCMTTLVQSSSGAGASTDVPIHVRMNFIQTNNIMSNIKSVLSQVSNSLQVYKGNILLNLSIVNVFYESITIQ